MIEALIVELRHYGLSLDVPMYHIPRAGDYVALSASQLGYTVKSVLFVVGSEKIILNLEEHAESRTQRAQVKMQLEYEGWRSWKGIEEFRK